MQILRTVSWQRLDSPSQEIFTLSENNEAYVLKGTVEASPVLINYQVECDKQWRTRHVKVQQKAAGKTVELNLEVNEEQVWSSDGRAMPEMNGLLDVDVEFSPSTNTLPIRRLDLPMGQQKIVEAVWIRFEGLKLKRLKQKYSRISDRLYWYEHPESNFEATLEVDELGLVVRYGDLWRRVP